VLASLSLGWGGFAVAGADGSPAVANTVGVLNVQSDGTVQQQRFLLAEVSGGVDASNKAVAVSSCERCRTAAAAMEVALVSNMTGPVVVANHADAVNLDCSTCATSATAHQFVVTSPGAVWLSGAGHEQLDALRRRFERLELASTPDELTAEVATIAAGVQDVLDRELRWEPPQPSPAEVDPLSMADAVVPYEVHHSHVTRTAAPVAG
jgi:hypothetical protein